MAFVSGGLRPIIRLNNQFKFYIYQNALLSVEAAVASEPKLPRCRTLENDPLCHTEEHAGKYYTIQNEVKKRLFLAGGIPKVLELQMKTFRESCIMVRKPAVEIISDLKSMKSSQPAVRFVIYGKNGVGKTCTLIHLVHFAHRDRYLLLHVPWAPNWTKRQQLETAPSQYHPDRIDLPLESAMWLQHFKSQNSELLKELNLCTTKSYSWSKREMTEEGSPLTDIIEHGIERMQHASDCVAVILKEIKHQSKSGRFKTLVIIDGVNAFYTKTNVKRSDKSLVEAKDLTMIRAFQKMLRADWTNAAVVVTVDNIIGVRKLTADLPFTPLALLGKEGFEVLDPFIPVLVDNYTDKEFESNVDYYEDTMWIQNKEALTEEGRAQLKFLSGKNPHYLMKLCDPL